MGVQICIDLECGVTGVVINPVIKVRPDNHTVSEMNIATSTVKYATELAAQCNQLQLKAKYINGENKYGR